MTGAGEPVRMTRAGNSRMLPVPAAVARRLRAEPGSRFRLEVLGADLIYHRLDDGEPGLSVTGSGQDRVYRPDSVGFADNRPGAGLLDGWEW